MKLAITFPNHWAIKNILHSGVAAHLQDHCEIIGLAHPSRIPHLVGLVEQLGLRPIEWVPYAHPPEHPKLTRLRRLQKGFVFERQNVATERIMRERGKRSRAEKIASALIRPVAQSSRGELVAKWLIRRRWDLTAAAAIPEVDLLFTTNPVDFREDPLVKSAREAGIRVVTMIPSWDNLSSKGVLFCEFDAVFVWNEVMQREVREFLPNLSERQVPIVGIPRFGIYENQPSPRPAKRRILFANTATKSCPDQPAVARHLAEALQAGAFGDAELLVRCHPHDNPSDYDFLKTFTEVLVWPESADAFGVDTVPPSDDLVNLRDMLQSSDVCVNCASTIVLDAAANDVPIISVAYDGDRKLSHHESVARFYEYTHQKPFLKIRAAELVSSRADLIKAVQEALANPLAKQEQRATLARLATTGQPQLRLAKALLQEQVTRRVA